MTRTNAKRTRWGWALAALLVVGGCSSVTEPRLPEENPDDPKNPPGDKPAMVEQVDALPIFV